MKVTNRFIVFFVLSATLMVMAGCSGNQTKADDEWIQLFNGKDLEGWTVKIKGYPLGENFGNTFRVEDSILKVRYDQYEAYDEKFAHLFYKDEFSHYILRAEYRFVEEQCPGAPGWAYRNSGIMLHGQSPESMTVDQDFPASIEYQLLGSDSTRMQVTGSVCTPGTNIVMNGELILEHCIQSSSESFMDDQWVTAEVEVRGNEVIRHIINGVTVMEYNEPQLDDREAYYDKLEALNNGTHMLSSGTISLQSEGHPCDFKNVEIKVLEE